MPARQGCATFRIALRALLLGAAPEGVAYLARNRWFESVSLQRRVRCEPVSRGNSPFQVEKPRFSAVVRTGTSGLGRQRHARRGNMWPKGGDISVGPYSSTAPPVMRSATMLRGRDTRGAGISARKAVISLSGPIPVSHRR